MPTFFMCVIFQSEGYEECYQMPFQNLNKSYHILTFNNRLMVYNKNYGVAPAVDIHVCWLALYAQEKTRLKPRRPGWQQCWHNSPSLAISVTCPGRVIINKLVILDRAITQETTNKHWPPVTIDRH